jgi:hypothetical protein
MNFQQKYIKYKAKYLALKNSTPGGMVGGAGELKTDDELYNYFMELWNKGERYFYVDIRDETHILSFVLSYINPEDDKYNISYSIMDNGSDQTAYNANIFSSDFRNVILSDRYGVNFDFTFMEILKNILPTIKSREIDWLGKMNEMKMKDKLAEEHLPKVLARLATTYSMEDLDDAKYLRMKEKFIDLDWKNKIKNMSRQTDEVQKHLPKVLADLAQSYSVTNLDTLHVKNIQNK